MRRIVSIAKHELRVLRRDVMPFVVLLALPIALMAFLEPAQATMLAAQGYDGNGAAQAVPGMAVMFSFFIVGFVGLVFFREHGWNTWVRLRASRARPFELMAGKVFWLVVIGVMQLAVLFVVGVLLFDFDAGVSWPAMTAISMSMVVANVAFGVLVVAYARTITQVNAVANLGGVVSAGLAGALVPFDAIPGWAQPIAPATPAYWAMDAYRAVSLDGAGVGGVVVQCAFVIAFAIGFTLAAAQRFSIEEAKTAWA